jgi:hypothetical protein
MLCTRTPPQAPTRSRTHPHALPGQNSSPTLTLTPTLSPTLTLIPNPTFIHNPTLAICIFLISFCFVFSLSLSLPLSLPISFPFHLISTKTPLTHYSNTDVPFSNMDVHLRKLYVSQRGIFFFNPSGICLVLPKIFGQKNVEGKSLQVPLVDIHKNKYKTPTAQRMYKHEEEPLLRSSSPTKKRRSLPSFYSGREDNLRTNTNPPDSRPKAVTFVRSGLSRAKEKDPTVEKCEEDVILVDLSFWPEPTPLISESVLKGDIEILKNQFRAVLQHSKQSFHREVQQEIRRNRDIFEDKSKNQRAAFELRLAKERADRANVGSIRQESVAEVLKAGTDSSDPLLSQHQSSIQGTYAPPRRHQSEVLQGLIEDLITLKAVDSEGDLMQF